MVLFSGEMSVFFLIIIALDMADEFYAVVNNQFHEDFIKTCQ